MNTKKTATQPVAKSRAKRANAKSIDTPNIQERLLALTEPTKALNARLPASVIERMENYLRETPGGLVHGSKTALVQGILVHFLEQQDY